MRVKNVRNILLKNVIDACIAAVAWWAVGSAFAEGNTNGCGNAIIGTTNFFAMNLGEEGPVGYAKWLFGYAFSATSSTIVSGAVAERVQFRSYLIYTSCISAFIYPVIAHWVWSSTGWLSANRVQCNTYFPDPVFSGTNGLLDFAGSGVVHMVGGGAALIGAIFAGPRIGRFQNGFPVHFENANPSQMTLGVLILWLGWYGFNAGSTGCMYGCMTTAALAAVNTTISAAAGGLSCLVGTILIGAPGDIGPLINGILAGAVSITASCAFVHPYAAFVIGAVGGIEAAVCGGIKTLERGFGQRQLALMRLGLGQHGAHVFAHGGHVHGDGVVFLASQGLRNHGAAHLEHVGAAGRL